MFEIHEYRAAKRIKSLNKSWTINLLYEYWMNSIKSIEIVRFIRKLYTIPIYLDEAIKWKKIYEKEK